MSSKKLKISPALYEKLEKTAEIAGYSSAEELALHVLEEATASSDDSLSEEEVRKRLKGLQYLE
jgi:hypothetical protein